VERTSAHPMFVVLGCDVFREGVHTHDTTYNNIWIMIFQERLGGIRISNLEILNDD
jgi:hypothetical protein